MKASNNQGIIPHMPVCGERFPNEGLNVELYGRKVNIGFDFVIYLMDETCYRLLQKEPLVYESADRYNLCFFINKLQE